VDGGADRACRASRSSPKPDDHLQLHLGTASLDACKGLCANASVCMGIEYCGTTRRCEVWVKDVGASAARRGFTCLRYRPPDAIATTQAPTTTVTPSPAPAPGLGGLFPWSMPMPPWPLPGLPRHIHVPQLPRIPWPPFQQQGSVNRTQTTTSPVLEGSVSRTKTTTTPAPAPEQGAGGSHKVAVAYEPVPEPWASIRARLRPAPKLTPVGRRPLTRTMYMYRAQSDVEYPIESVNAADLIGVLWYLHNEVVVSCPRKYGITRVKRLKVTIHDQTIPYVAFDRGQCTVPGCEAIWNQNGFAVGCQNVPYGQNLTSGRGGLQGHWYSLPGECPSQPIGKKNRTCIEDSPGGACAKVTGERDCTYHVEPAGEVRLDELTGIKDYGAFCAAGNLEFSTPADRGIHFNFWDGKSDTDRCAWRYNRFMDAFREKYPDLPLTLGWQTC